MHSEVLKIIEGGITGDLKSVIDYSKILATKLEQEGENNYSKAIFEILNNKSTSSTTLDWINSDNTREPDNFFEFVKPEDSNDSLYFDPLAEIKIKNVINRINYQDSIPNNARDIKNSVLLYGPAGCGKTTIAKYISCKTNLPLLIPKLSFLISSSLDKRVDAFSMLINIAKSEKCIVFFDEFDAIAKSRVKQFEIGNPNSLINNVLLCIDELSAITTILAATDRQDLLDDGVWGRFNSTIEVTKLDSNGIKKLIEITLNGVNSDLIEDEKKINSLVNIFSNRSHAEIKNTIQVATAQSLINDNSNNLDYYFILQEVFKTKKKGEEGFRELVNFLNNQGITQKTISDNFNISMRQVRNYLNKAEQ